MRSSTKVSELFFIHLSKNPSAPAGRDLKIFSSVFDFSRPKESSQLSTEQNLNFLLQHSSRSKTPPCSQPYNSNHHTLQHAPHSCTARSKTCSRIAAPPATALPGVHAPQTYDTHIRTHTRTYARCSHHEDVPFYDHVHGRGTTRIIASDPVYTSTLLYSSGVPSQNITTTITVQ